MATPDAFRSALTSALESVGERWALLVISALINGPKRFSELQADVDGIAPNVLTQRLRRLERDGLVVARPYSERPRRFVYELTSSGAELGDVLTLLAGWGARNSREEQRPLHEVCGTPLEVAWWCPTCEQPVSGEDHEELHFA